MEAADKIVGIRFGERLSFLDSLRGIAIISVLLCHGLGYLSPAFQKFSSEMFDLGTFGVELFFLCSGFIIPASLERHGSLWRFWTNRIFRLYPLYWINIGIWLFLVSSDYPVKMILTNLTMLQTCLGTNNLVNLYWTLTVEMLFYLTVSALFTISSLKRSTLFALGFLSAGALAGGGTLGYLGMMFVGSVFYRLYTDETSRRMTALVVAAAITADIAEAFVHGSVGLFTAQLGAYAIFAMEYRSRSSHHLGFLVYLGVISYSLYLMHLVVSSVLIPETGVPVLTLALWVSLSILISSMTYYYVERPGIAFGRRLIAALEGRTEGQPMREAS